MKITKEQRKDIVEFTEKEFGVSIFKVKKTLMAELKKVNEEIKDYVDALSYEHLFSESKSESELLDEKEHIYMKLLEVRGTDHSYISFTDEELPKIDEEMLLNFESLIDVKAPDPTFYTTATKVIPDTSYLDALIQPS